MEDDDGDERHPEQGPDSAEPRTGPSPGAASGGGHRAPDAGDEVQRHARGADQVGGPTPRKPVKRGRQVGGEQRLELGPVEAQARIAESKFVEMRGDEYGGGHPRRPDRDSHGGWIGPRPGGLGSREHEPEADDRMDRERGEHEQELDDPQRREGVERARGLLEGHRPPQDHRVDCRMHQKERAERHDPGERKEAEQGGGDGRRGTHFTRMPTIVRKMRIRLGLAGVGLVAATACAGEGGFSGPAPVTLLASSRQSTAAFGAIRAAWVDPETNPVALRSMIEDFLARFPHDEVVPVARVALALVALGQGDFATADAQLDLTSSLSPGAARDLWTIATAERFRLRGDAEDAFELLRPMAGKNVDPLGRSIFEEELTLSALSTRRDDEAIASMDEWLRAAPEEDKARAIERVARIVARLPKDVLVRAFRAMRARGSTLGSGVDIHRILRERLVEIATTTGDGLLARTLLDSDPDAFAGDGPTRGALGELANSRRGLDVVAGRTVGLLLPSQAPGLRDESADVLRGAMWALGLPAGVRAAAVRAKVASPDRAPSACGPSEPAPEVGEPTPEEGVRLVTRDDSGGAARTDLSLDELAGDGAAIVIAGLDGPTATRALRWGAAHSVPVVALAAPDEPVSPSPFEFVLGEPRASVLDALSRAVPALDSQPVTPIVGWSAMSTYPAGGGSLLGLTLAPPIPCDVAAARAGDPRFVVEPSGGGKAIAWLVGGSRSCANEVVSELTAQRARGVVVLTLEAAAVPAHAEGLRVVSAQAGIVPEVPRGDSRDDEVQRFSAALGSVGWWTALGRDAAVLARLAVRGLEGGAVSDAPTVAARRASARAALAAARAKLWTSEASGWSEQGGAHPYYTMRRSVCALEVPPR